MVAGRGGGGGFWVGRVGLGRWSGIDRESRRSARGGGVAWCLFPCICLYSGIVVSSLHR